jgi:hypothetical protein
LQSTVSRADKQLFESAHVRILQKADYLKKRAVFSYFDFSEQKAKQK